MHSQLALRFIEAAKALRVSRNTIERLVAEGELPAFRVGEGRCGRRISLRAIEAFMAKRTFNDISL
jgi:excisionase family DNA binding protein